MVGYRVLQGQKHGAESHFNKTIVVYRRKGGCFDQTVTVFFLMKPDRL